MNQKSKKKTGKSCLYVFFKCKNNNNHNRTKKLTTYFFVCYVCIYCFNKTETLKKRRKSKCKQYKFFSKINKLYFQIVKCFLFPS